MLIKKGPKFHTRATASLQDLQVMRDHLAYTSILHNTMATNFDTATEAKIALVSLLVGLGITLGVLIASAGSTAPVTVPAAAFEVAGGAVSIGLMTEAEAAATAATAAIIGVGLGCSAGCATNGFGWIRSDGGVGAYRVASICYNVTIYRQSSI